MKKNVLGFLFVCLLVIVAVQVFGGRGDIARAEDAPTAVKKDYADGASKTAEFVGEKACKKCHFKVHKAWKKKLHAGAWEALPEEHRNTTSKDEQGRACASCHTTGFGATAQKGFVDAATSAHLRGVQCESCHGAGSEHMAATKELKAKKLKKFPAGANSFMAGAGRDCRDCHNSHFSFKKKFGPKDK